MGHIESDGTHIFMPTSMTRSSANRIHPLMKLKQDCVNHNYRMMLVFNRSDISTVEPNISFIITQCTVVPYVVEL